MAASHVDVVVIGAGHAGLAMSWCLAERSIDHVVLERGIVANSWQAERWDSLRLLTPNWFSRLPGWSYRGDDPDGYMGAADVVGYLDAYRRSFRAPVRTGTTVRQLTAAGRDHRITTDDGEWICGAVVIATGPHGRPRIPPCAAELPCRITQLSSASYRNPEQLGAGAVLVVGAAASGAQIAEELVASGRPVTLAVGDHVRMPRLYRGRDIYWWLEATGRLRERYDAVDDLDRARRLPSLQLKGSAHRLTLDLNSLRDGGVEIVGRLVDVVDGRARFAGSLAQSCTAADLKLRRFLDEIDRGTPETLGETDEGPGWRPAPTVVDDQPANTLPLNSIEAVIWATGHRPHYPWIDARHLDAKGWLRHEGGVLAQPGLYALGLPFLRRRKSALIGGVGQDAVELSGHLAGYLSGLTRSHLSAHSPIEQTA